jgi:fibronectin type 3 domain-containing protein
VGSALKPPTISATDGTISDRVRITWNEMPDVTTYKLFRSTSANGTFAEIASTAGLTLDVTSGSTVPQFFQVRSSNANGDSQPSNTESGFPGLGAPTNLQASDGTFPNKVQVTWDAVSGATSYKVFRSSSATGAFTQVAVVSGTSIDNTTASDNPLFFKIKASAAIGDSVFSLVDGGFRQ